MAMADDALLERFRTHRRPEDLEAVVVRFRPLARRLARRYARTGIPLDDLDQVACLGLLKALRRFEPARGNTFATFAVPTILGELRRHCRETLWPVHVPRTVQERAAAVHRHAGAVATTRGRRPSVAELADALDCSAEDVIDAILARSSRATVPLEAPASSEDHDAGAVEWLGAEDPGYALVEDLACVSAAVGVLTGHERELLRLRYEEDLSQREIARRTGLSEAGVGHLLASALDRMRTVAAAREPGRPVAAAAQRPWRGGAGSRGGPSGAVPARRHDEPYVGARAGC